MTKKEVKEYLQEYCGLNFMEEDCTLENVLNLIPNVDGEEQHVIFAYHIPLSEHCLDELVYGKPLQGELTLMRDDDGVWTIDWDLDGVTGVLPQSEDLMEAALYMCEFCTANGMSLFNQKMRIEQ